MTHTKGILEINSNSKAIQIAGSNISIALICIVYDMDNIEVRRDGESWLDMRARTNPQRVSADEEKKANADRIVKTWNSHDELLQALENLLNIDEVNQSEAFQIRLEATRAINNAK